MAYSVKYIIEFLNVQEDIFQVKILEKDFTGSVMQLRGSAIPFTTRQGGVDEDKIINPIRAKECIINFISENGIDLTDFYSEDDEFYRIDYYCQSVGGIVIDQLLSSYYLVQDNCQQDFAAAPFEVSLSGTDNLALLKDVPFTSEGMSYDPDDGTEYIGKIPVFDFFKIAIQKTGLSDLPLRSYCNIFENTTEDRSDTTGAETFKELTLHTGEFLNDDGTWQDLYSIIEKILFRFNACLFQDAGAWNIIRYFEGSLFVNNQIQGVQHNLTDDTIVSISLFSEIDIAFTTNLALDKADQVRRIQRPFKFAKETFNYTQPASLIIGGDLQKIGDFISSSTVGDLKYDRYEIPAVWRHENSSPSGTTLDTSYIEVVTDNTNDTEVSRYIVDPNTTDEFKWLMFNPIEVSAGDSFDFTCQFKSRTDTGDVMRVFFRFQIFYRDGVDTKMDSLHNVSPDILHWEQFSTGEFYKVDLGIWVDIAGSVDQAEWQTFSLSSLLQTHQTLPSILRDGILVIGLDGTNNTNLSVSKEDVFMKDFELTFTNKINESTKIIGQYHLHEQDNTIKNNYDEEIFIDDSPRNTIAGTLFTDATTDFAWINVLDVYFTKTTLWHRVKGTEALRLGEITTYERMKNAIKSRTVLEGSFYGLRRNIGPGVYTFISLLNFLQIDSLPRLIFIFGNLEIDYMNAGYKAVLNELYNEDDEEIDSDYSFNYIYEST